MRLTKGHRTMLGILVGVILYELYDRKIATGKGPQP